MGTKTQTMNSLLLKRFFTIRKSSGGIKTIDMCKWACQVTAQVAANIPSISMAKLVGLIGTLFLKKCTNRVTVKTDPMSVIIQPMIGELKDVICSPNIRQFIIAGILFVGNPLE
ncbi:MAG: hypothetical protein ACTSQ8_23160, partial [Candidatus Helarchaeota archaeon]